MSSFNSYYIYEHTSRSFVQATKVELVQDWKFDRKQDTERPMLIRITLENKGKILASNDRLLVDPAFSFSFKRPAGSAPDIVETPLSAADQQRFNSVTIKQHIEDLPPGSTRDFELDVFTGVLVDIVTHEDHFLGKVDQFRIQSIIDYSD